MSDFHYEFAFDERCTFDREYLRNNKSTDAKNLRCFPRCKDEAKGGHSDRGFCGNNITGHLHIFGYEKN